jgi:hypothetical protein
VNLSTLGKRHDHQRDLLGEMALLGQHIRSATVRVEKDAVWLRLSNAQPDGRTGKQTVPSQPVDQHAGEKKHTPTAPP